MRVLVCGWFGYAQGEATAGDLLAARTVCGWLESAGVPYDLVLSPAFGHGALPAAHPVPAHRDLRLEEADPAAYTHAVFVCGPVAGAQVRRWLDRFAGCVRIGVGVSVVDGTPDGFDLLIPRDRAGVPTDGEPDLAVAAPAGRAPPVVALVRAHPQPEHPGGRHDAVHALIEARLRRRDLAVLPLDTRVDPRELTNRTPEQVTAVLARADVVVTTRLHGLVLALCQGVPALAVDPVSGGAKVTRQASALGWPAVVSEPELAARFDAMLDWCLGPDAAATTRRCVARARQRVDSGTRERLLAALAVGHRDPGPAAGRG